MVTDQAVAGGVLQWAPGVELVRTSVRSIHVVGDLETQVVLAEVGESCVDWLAGMSGQRSFKPEVEFAGSFGVEAGQAREILNYLVQVGALSTVQSCPQVRTCVMSAMPYPLLANLLGVVGEHHFTFDNSGGGVGLRSHWESVVDESVSSEFEAVVVALAREAPDQTEVEFSSYLRSRGVRHLVISAGARRARVGPLVDVGYSCLRCEHLARCESEPYWAYIATQLAIQRKQAPRPADEFVALAAAEARRQLGSDAQSPYSRGAVGWSGFRGGTWQYRPVPLHRRCDCWRTV